MKKFSKIVALLLALAMILSLVACGAETTEAPTEAQPTETQTEAQPSETEPESTEEDIVDDYTKKSQEIYQNVLGEYYEYVQKANEAETVSERFALQAIAEAKLLESAVMLPLSSNGGTYAISRLVPYTATPCLWGNDSYRYHNVLIVDGDPLTLEERNELKALYAEKKGTGTWMDSAKAWLAAKGYALNDEYALGYNSDPQTWDVLGTSRAADSEAIVNCYDGLMEYNEENALAPALAESYTVSEDGLVYTFKLREGIKWVDSQKRVVADLKADDFVAGMQHMCDVAGGLEYLIGADGGHIVNADEYVAGEITDFAEVGVKAVDDLTVEYTLTQPTTYFTTMLGYGVFAPMSREFYTSKGGKFGAEFDAEAESYTYGKTPDDIAYCGPYVVTSATAENSIIFEANPEYWNKDGINIHKITWLYNDGQDATKAYQDMKAGTLAGCGLGAAALEAAKADGMFEKYAYVSATDATAFMAFFNINRAQFVNINDETAAVSPQTEEEAARTNAAMNNVHFRRALMASLDRAAYNAQTVGEDLKLTSLINGYTPGTFVSLEEEITVDINGTATTFPAGTFYGAIEQAQIDADGVKIKVWDPEQDGGLGSSAGFDGWYDEAYAVEEFAKAIAELKEAGLEITKEAPIQIDLPAFTGSEIYQQRAQAFKQSAEKALDGQVQINLIDCPGSKEWYYAGYYTDYGYEANYDIYDVSGWGPDYGDPSTYLGTFLPDYSGYMVKCIGIF